MSARLEKLQIAHSSALKGVDEAAAALSGAVALRSGTEIAIETAQARLREVGLALASGEPQSSFDKAAASLAAEQGKAAALDDTVIPNAREALRAAQEKAAALKGRIDLETMRIAAEEELFPKMDALRDALTAFSELLVQTDADCTDVLMRHNLNRGRIVRMELAAAIPHSLIPICQAWKSLIADDIQMVDPAWHQKTNLVWKQNKASFVGRLAYDDSLLAPEDQPDDFA